MYLAGMLITAWLGILSTRANVSFARMRRKYIEDNEEPDKKLIAKVEGFYHHSYMVLAVTELGAVVAAFVFACLTWEVGAAGESLLSGLLVNTRTGILCAVRILFYVIMALVYWIAVLEYAEAEALDRPLEVLAAHTWFIRLLLSLFRPLVTPGIFLVRSVFKKRNRNFYNKVNFTYSEDEIRCIVEESHRGGRLNASENMLLKNSFDFFGLLVKDVMIPRSQMAVLYVEDDMESLRKKISKSPHTRYPVCREDKDDILGFVHVKDFMESYLHREKSVKGIIHEILMVPEVMPASSLTQLMRTRRIYIAVVVDEYGGTVGMVTLEDLVEELVGEIPEDLGAKPKEIVRHDNGTYEFDGMVILDDISDCLGIPFEEGGSASTIGGRIFSKLEHVPRIGDSIQFSNWKFTVIRMDGLRIRRVKAEPVAPQKEVKPGDAETENHE